MSSSKKFNPNENKGVIFTPSKVIAHPDAIKISVESFFKIYDKNHDGRMNRADIKEALTEIFKDFEVNTKVTDRDVETFLNDFKIDPSTDISFDDFKGVEFIRFDLQQGVTQEKKEQKDIY